MIAQLTQPVRAEWLTAALAAALVLALCGCARSQRAQPELPEPLPSPFESVSALEEVATLCSQGSSREVALDAITDAGFSAEDLLAYAEGTHEETIRWGLPEGFRIGPESGERALVITVERAADHARDFKPDTDEIGHGARCRPWIEVDVTVSLQSEDGALNERFDATLYSTDARGAYLHAKSAELELAGELTVTRDLTPETITAASFMVMMTFSEHGVNGTLVSDWSRLVSAADLAWTESIELAYWGRVRCATGAYSVGMDEPVELWAGEGGRATPGSAADWINGFGAVPVTWMNVEAQSWADGERTTAAFTFAPAEGACVVIHTISSEPYQELSLPGELELRTADGRIDARWTGDVTIQDAADGAATDTWFFADTLAMPDAYTATPRELGFPLQSRGDLDQLSASFNLRLNADGEASGEVQLYGYVDTTDCELIVDPACAGSSYMVPLEHGMFGTTE